MLLRLIFVLTLFSMPLTINSANAQENADKNAKYDIAKAQNEALNEKVASTLKKLTQEEAVHFLTMYGNYNIYSLVKAVRDDVKDATDACAKNNKTMEDDITERFSKWDKNVSKSMAEVNANIKNLSLAQTYISQSELKIIFGLIDEIRAVNSSRFETTPVTTPEACEFMLSKMDETEKQMVGMLRATLASYPDAIKKTQK